MKIAFHANPLCHRGTTTATLDYAKYNQEILGNESVILYNKSPVINYNDPGITPQDPSVVEYVKLNFNTIGYYDFSEVEQLCQDNNITHFYNLKAGYNDGVLVPGVKNLVHAVFNTYDPHGDKYAYVSSWLAEQNYNVNLSNPSYVPHIVNLPEYQTIDWRSSLGIPDDVVIIGRYGGLNQFDIPFVIEEVYHFAISNPKYLFLFVNTRPFCNLPNVLFFDPVISPQDKSNFILSCDAMLHARSDGESFGLAICEGLFHNKPVFCLNGGRDKHHIKLLSGTGLLYDSREDLHKHLMNVKSYTYEYRTLVSQFSPENVMRKFQEVFLK